MFAATIVGLSVALMIGLLVAIFFRYVVMRDFSTVTTEYKVLSPKTGGLAIAGAFLIGISLIQLIGDITPIKARYFWGFVGSLVLIASVSLYETFKRSDSRIRVLGEALATALVLGAGVVVSEFHLPWVGWIIGGWWSYPLTLLWIFGLTHAYKQMDGLDGLAASTAIIASAFFSYISFRQESVFIYLCSVVLFSAAAGFLIFNRLLRECRIGDIEGTFLGFSFAVMAIIAGLYDRSHTSMLVVPLLLFHFIFDAVFTCARTIWSQGRMPRNQSDYLYQLLVRAGYSNRSIILIHSAMAASQGVGAIAMINIQGSGRVWVFLPFLLIQAIYAYQVVRLARNRTRI